MSSRAKLVMVYHGTTADQLGSIERFGLRKGSWVSRDLVVAWSFAYSRAHHLRSPPVIVMFQVSRRELRERQDRRGRREAQLRKALYSKSALLHCQ